LAALAAIFAISRFGPIPTEQVIRSSSKTIALIRAPTSTAGTALAPVGNSR